MAGGARDRVQGFDHHLCHAASAYFASPFDRALIVTLDERGDGRCGFAGRRQKARKSARSPGFFSALARLGRTRKSHGYSDFGPHGDEHKTQWLSTTGEPVFADFFTGMLQRSPQSPPHLNVEIFSARFCRRAFFQRRVLPDAWESPAKPSLIWNSRLSANIAASFQQACTDIVVEWLETLRKQTGERHLCVAGGLFLNPLLVADDRGKNGIREYFRPAGCGQRRHRTRCGVARVASIAGQARASHLSRASISARRIPTNRSSRSSTTAKPPIIGAIRKDQKIDERSALAASGQNRCVVSGRRGVRTSRARESKLDRFALGSLCDRQSERFCKAPRTVPAVCAFDTRRRLRGLF